MPFLSSGRFPATDNPAPGAKKDNEWPYFVRLNLLPSSAVLLPKIHNTPSNFHHFTLSLSTPFALLILCNNSLVAYIGGFGTRTRVL